MGTSLELYVHIPFCMKKCKYCDFLSFPAEEKQQREYTQALLREIAYYGKRMQSKRVSTIFIGGGTPSWLDEKLMLQILEAIHSNFTVEPDAEITMECNPGTLIKDKLRSYRQAGVNRLSIGLQSADDEELKLLGRVHTFGQFLKTYEMAREVGFTNINVDLMSCLPYQTAEKFLKTLKTVVRLKPEHISAYTLIIEEGTPFYEDYKGDVNRLQQGMPTAMLPDEEEAYRIYKTSQNYLKEMGYEQYEISNFARNGLVCRHNVGYWTRENYLGLGIGAASLLDNVRYSNTRDIYEYIKNSYQITEDPNEPGKCNLHESREMVSRKAQMEEFMFLGLRMKQGVTREEFERRFDMPIEGIYPEVLEHLKTEGLLEMSQGRIYLTYKGMDLGNYSMSQFLLSGEELE
ncbi:MAG: oxygen-independent coproporphyrinogen III oxidase [Agathobacter sp.]|nr:oxygen-independent coproporphyrinogen III oxidase [Agathobacter sp.]